MAGRTEYKNKWAAENLDQLRLTVPKGKREPIQTHARALGFKGYADYIKDLIEKDSGISLDREKHLP